MAVDPKAAEEAPAFDIAAAADKLAGDLWPEQEESQAESLPEPNGEAQEATPAQVEKPADAAPAVRQVPKTWPKEMHEHWGKVDPKVQEYWETREKQMLDGLTQYKNDAIYARSLREAIEPYRPTFPNGADDLAAIKGVLDAHHRFRTADLPTRLKMFDDLARSNGIDLRQALAGQAAAPTAPPEVKALQDRLNAIESGLASREQATAKEAKTRIAREVEQFASDPAHPYFDDVADDIVAMVKIGADLKDAYEKAVWANPVTRAKEIARIQTENEAKTKENMRLDALKARKASESNVRGRDTKRTPTESLGTMEDTMKATLAEIRSRSH